MKVTRWQAAKQYAAKKHFGMAGFRLQGQEATQTQNFWVGLSQFLPGGGAEKGSSPTEKVYVVLEGEVTIVTNEGETVLGPLDSCLIAPNEERSVENRTNNIARMLVVSPN
jgi:quercetin dioxygenase-like cupin family protein